MSGGVWNMALSVWNMAESSGMCEYGSECGGCVEYRSESGGGGGGGGVEYG